MIRRYCDCCDVELPDDGNAVQTRIEGDAIVSGRVVNYQLTLGTGEPGQWNSGELCDACALIALLSDERSRRVLATIAKTFGFALAEQSDGEYTEPMVPIDVTKPFKS